MTNNTNELDESEEWISGIRRELKKKVVRKKEKEAVINKLYAYMHDIFGAEVIELFDMEYDPEEKYRKKEEAAAEKQDGQPQNAQTGQREEAGKTDNDALNANEEAQTPKP